LNIARLPACLSVRTYSEIVWLGAGRTAPTRANANRTPGFPNSYVCAATNLRALAIPVGQPVISTKTEAEIWLTRKETELIDGEWIDPDAGAILVPDYGATRIEERAGLRPKTVSIYRGLLRCHITPHLATVTVGSLTLARVRRWRKALLDSGVSPVTTAKAYRLLRAIMNTAVDDGLIRRNPCRIKGAGTRGIPRASRPLDHPGLRAGRCGRASLPGADPAGCVH
jgi:hypothetical protein